MTATTVPSWLNKGTNPVPDWLQPHKIGRQDPNGTFMIRTKAGKEEVQARVLVGHLVFEYAGTAYAREPDDARALLTELEEEASGFCRTLPKGGDAPGAQVAPDPDGADDPDDISRRIRAAERSKSATRLRAKPVSRRPAAKVGHDPAIGAMPTIEWVHVEKLRIDASYQRTTDNGPSKALIKRIGKSWDWRLCVPLMVSRRPEGLFVIDGQHRLEGAQLRADIPQLPCCISTFDTPADEAAMFVAANRARRPMNRLDDFHAALAAGDADASAIKRQVEAVGFTIARNTSSAAWKPGEVAFTSAVASALRKHGEDVVRTVLTGMATAFPNQVLTTGGAIFSAVTRLLTSGREIDRDRLWRALRRYDVKGWASFVEGQDGGTDRAAAMREALLMAYEETAPADPAGPLEPEEMAA